MAVVVKKEEKIKVVFNAMSDINDVQEFKLKFKQLYPNDWKKINTTYLEEERKDVKRRGHPMPHPEKYLENMHKTAMLKKNREK